MKSGRFKKHVWVVEAKASRARKFIPVAFFTSIRKARIEVTLKCMEHKGTYMYKIVKYVPYDASVMEQQGL